MLVLFKGVPEKNISTLGCSSDFRTGARTKARDNSAHQRGIQTGPPLHELGSHSPQFTLAVMYRALIPSSRNGNRRVPAGNRENGALPFATLLSCEIVPSLCER